jgi:UDP-2,4-diacetamido-2,4,6-trideoxy-beta-L-altropyranose hydrolase
MIYIRADANFVLGSGHIMRCLTIAKVLREKGQDVKFITADQEAENIIKKYNFSYVCLESDWNSLEDELPKLKKLISEDNVQAVIFDSYLVTKKYLEEVRKLVKVVYLDDLNQFIYPVDILINYNIYAERIPYMELYPAKPKLLLGCNYVPLREEFIGKKKVHSQVGRDVLITTGGADTYNIAGQLLTHIRMRQEFDQLTLHIVAGPLNRNIELLKERIKEYPMVLLHQNVSDMSELMLKCDVAISAGGSTLYELCSCGVPAISFSYADNQLLGVKEFDRQNIIYYTGDFREDSSVCICNIISKLSVLCNDNQLREKLSIKMQELVDGFGACRISEELLI